VLSVVVGKRTAQNVEAVVKDFYARTEGRLMRLITTDEYSCYETAILEAYGQTLVPERTGRPGRPKAPYKVAPEELCYATVRKTRKKGRVEEIIVGAVFGSLEMIEAALKHSLGSVGQSIQPSSSATTGRIAISTLARYARRTASSKDWQVHEAL
jgi:hypothetical protein